MPGKLWRKLKCTLLSERNLSVKDTDYMIPAMWYPGEDSCGDNKEISGCQGLWGMKEHRGFYGSETSLCDTIMVDPVTIQVSKPIGYTTAAVSPNVNYGLGVIMTCQSRFIHCNKCTIWWGMLIKVKLRIHRGQRFMASLSTFLSAVLQTKTALKNKVYLKIWGLPRWSSG